MAGKGKPGGFSYGTWAGPHLLPAWCQVRYRRQCGGVQSRPVDLWAGFGQASQDSALLVRFKQEEGALHVEVGASEDVVVEMCHVEFHRTFADDERILLNGYQSWTDTAELAPNARMPGLTRVPQAVVRHWALDGGGDYAFAPYTGRPGQLHGFTYLDVRRGQRHELLASLGEDQGFTMIALDTRASRVAVAKECSSRVLHSDETRTLCALVVASGTCDQVYDRWFRLSGTRALPAKPLVGYSSWYRHYGDIDAAKIAADLEGARCALDSVDCKGFCRLFQIDDGYCKIGDWKHPDALRFPGGMAPLAERIRQAGFVPGIWAAPFVCERQSRLAREHPDWLLRDAAGAPVSTGCQWSGGLALDTLNPEVRDHVRTSLGTMVNEWGFKLIKADFLYAVCMVPHGGLNRGQLMADAMCLLREAVGPNVALVGCGVPLASAFGRVEYCRVGCDVGPDWDGAPHMRLLHRERVSTRNSLANTVYRFPLHGRAFANDPDVFFLRDDVELSADQKEQLLAVDASYGGMLVTSDDMGSWSPSSKALFQAAIEVMRKRGESQ